MIRYAEFLERTQFNKQELLASSWGTLIDDEPLHGVPTLPAPPMLMFDRILEIERRGNQGRIVAEQDIHLDSWFFQSHFSSDPVQPGCLGVDAIWQLIGYYAALRGAKGAGRALGSKEIEFFGQIRPHNKVVRYEVDIRRYAELKGSGSVLCIGTGRVIVDNEPIYEIKDAKVGIFEGIRYTDYPNRSANSVGGRLAK
jgi:3-hydroxyacyl-[acyl-carrier protein] dehydratase/trans-2-decenoyl-[acyl-carrier protein] isomerase